MHIRIYTFPIHTHADTDTSSNGKPCIYSDILRSASAPSGSISSCLPLSMYKSTLKSIPVQSALGNQLLSSEHLTTDSEYLTMDSEHLTTEDSLRGAPISPHRRTSSLHESTHSTRGETTPLENVEKRTLGNLEQQIEGFPTASALGNVLGADNAYVSNGDATPENAKRVSREGSAPLFSGEDQLGASQPMGEMFQRVLSAYTQQLSQENAQIERSGEDMLLGALDGNVGSRDSGNCVQRGTFDDDDELDDRSGARNYASGKNKLLVSMHNQDDVGVNDHIKTHERIKTHEMSPATDKANDNMDTYSTGAHNRGVGADNGHSGVDANMRMRNAALEMEVQSLRVQLERAVHKALSAAAAKDKALSKYLCVHACMRACMPYVCVFVRVCICMWVCVYVNMYMYVYMCVCVYIYIYI
jgi:hypothetical protein